VLTIVEILGLAVVAIMLMGLVWIVAIPLGGLMYQGLRALILHNSAVSLPGNFPPSILLATLVGVLVLTLLAIRGPLRHAARIQPGAALCYQ
jgi:hypothetical protein